jgi:multisubunit Na+/H+ antiporter MnhG subunit
MLRMYLFFLALDNISSFLQRSLFISSYLSFSNILGLFFLSDFLTFYNTLTSARSFNFILIILIIYFWRFIFKILISTETCPWSLLFFNHINNLPDFIVDVTI